MTRPGQQTKRDELPNLQGARYLPVFFQNIYGTGLAHHAPNVCVTVRCAYALCVRVCALSLFNRLLAPDR